MGAGVPAHARLMHLRALRSVRGQRRSTDARREAARRWRSAVVRRPPTDGRPALTYARTLSRRSVARRSPKDERPAHTFALGILGISAKAPSELPRRCEKRGGVAQFTLDPMWGITLPITCPRKTAKPAVAGQVDGRVRRRYLRLCSVDLQGNLSNDSPIVSGAASENLQDFSSTM